MKKDRDLYKDIDYEYYYEKGYKRLPYVFNAMCFLVGTLIVLFDIIPPNGYTVYMGIFVRIVGSSAIFSPIAAALIWFIIVSGVAWFTFFVSASVIAKKIKEITNSNSNINKD